MVLLLRLTSKRFSATQYAVLSSLFAIGRTVAGPVAGVLADALGWRDFFLVTIAFSAPGLCLLQRFVPWRERDLPTSIEGDGGRDVMCSPLAIERRALVGPVICGGILGFALATVALMATAALKAHRLGEAFSALDWLMALLKPSSLDAALDLLGALACAMLLGLTLAAHRAAQLAQRLDSPPKAPEMPATPAS